MPFPLRPAPIRRALALTLAASPVAPLAASSYPDIPEPMVFDMMRPLGAKRGELEVNTLAQAPLSGGDPIAWAPEIEYAFADGMAIEFELPFENRRLTELKLGLQAAFGAFNGGRSAHGVQYLGIYDRHSGDYSSTLVYMLGHRFSDRVSSMSMVGLGDIAPGKGRGHNALIANQSLFLNTDPATVLGVEFNFEGGHEGGVLVMPQIHRKLGAAFNVQAGFGVERNRGDVARPRVGIRIIREL
ncbi:hypothetical protein FHS96_003001 [Sphingomonas zeicaulis]|uniref:hypothetical protein n=1 Tax=Sphingomonas zeicaulis TaxID=1632740 RepID=UPI003D1D6E70